VENNWKSPLGGDPSDYGAWYTLALAVGAGWLATLLIIDAVVSPAAPASSTSAHRTTVLRARRGRGDAGFLSQVDKRGTP
jgi:hypothetical protein